MPHLRKISLMMCMAAILGCGSPSNERSVRLDELDSVQQATNNNMPPGPQRDILSADELISLADCSDLPCVQQFMKERSSDFIHARKGEFAALHRSVVKDTAGNELVMPLSTLYADVNPQASWRLAHTVHKLELGNQLMQEFHQLGFRFADSGNYTSVPVMQAKYISAQRPGKVLYVAATFEPWYQKGLYTRVSWPCWVFEVQNKE